MDHGYVDEGFTGLGQAFVIASQAARAAEPGKGAFYNPTFGQDLKTNLIAELSNNLQGPAKAGLDPGDQLTAIAAVGPNQLEPTPTRVLAVLDALKQRLQDLLRPAHILDTRGCHYHHQHQTQRVHHHMPLA